MPWVSVYGMNSFQAVGECLGAPLTPYSVAQLTGRDIARLKKARYRRTGRPKKLRRRARARRKGLQDKHARREGTVYAPGGFDAGMSSDGGDIPSDT